MLVPGKLRKTGFLSLKISQLRGEDRVTDGIRAIRTWARLDSDSQPADSGAWGRGHSDRQSFIALGIFYKKPFHICRCYFKGEWIKL